MKTVEMIGIGLGLAALAFAFFQTRMQEEELVLDEAAAHRSKIRRNMQMGIKPSREEVSKANRDMAAIADAIEAKGGYRPTARMTADGRWVGGF